MPLGLMVLLGIMCAPASVQAQPIDSPSSVQMDTAGEMSNGDNTIFGFSYLEVVVIVLIVVAVIALLWVREWPIAAVVIALILAELAIRYYHIWV